MKKRNVFIILFLLFSFIGFQDVSASGIDHVVLLDAGKVACGDFQNIPKAIPQLTKLFFDLMKIAVPIVLVIKGIIDMLKAVSAQKEDEIKKGQQTFIKRLVAAALFFLVVLITQFTFSVVGTDSEANTVASCINCFMNNSCR